MVTLRTSLIVPKLIGVRYTWNSVVWLGLSTDYLGKISMPIILLKLILTGSSTLRFVSVKDWLAGLFMITLPKSNSKGEIFTVGSP